MSELYSSYPDFQVDSNPNDIDDESKWAKFGKKGRAVPAITNLSRGDVLTNSNPSASYDIKYEATGFQNVKLTNPNAVCPAKPLILGRQHFIIPKEKVLEMCGNSSYYSTNTKYKSGSGSSVDLFTAVMRMIDTFLDFLKPNYDFSFNASQECNPMWNGKHIQGSVSCYIDVNIYTGDDEGSYTIEARRIMGDAKPFFSFYREFKALVTGIVPEYRPQQLQFKPLDAQELSDVDFNKAVEPIFRMTSSEFYETRLEGVKMLCDFVGNHNEQVDSVDFITKCVESLETLVFDSFTDICHHAIIALGCAVQKPCYRATMVSSRALPFLFHMLKEVLEPMYESIQVQRESANILATLARDDPRGVLENLQLNPNEFKVWTKKVVEFQCDDELYQFSAELRDNLVNAAA